jgi:hypothetical protein
MHYVRTEYWPVYRLFTAAVRPPIHACMHACGPYVNTAGATTIRPLIGAEEAMHAPARSRAYASFIFRVFFFFFQVRTTTTYVLSSKGAISHVFSSQHTPTMQCLARFRHSFSH